MARRFFVLLVSALSLSLAACGGTRVYRPSSAVDLRMDDPREIDDAQIRMAFGARPQMPSPARVAYYAFDDENAGALEAMLHGLQGISELYRIPTLLVTGRWRADEAQEQAPVTLRQLRLAAARAHCDLLLLVDYGYRIERTANGYAALNVLLVPALVAPWLDADVRSHLDAYVLDTRNGYLYAELRTEERAHERRMSPFSERDRRRVEAQRRELLARTRRELELTLRSDRAARGGPAPRVTPEHAPIAARAAAPDPR
jgi:hypothetical protein